MDEGPSCRPEACVARAKVALQGQAACSGGLSSTAHVWEGGRGEAHGATRAQGKRNGDGKHPPATFSAHAGRFLRGTDVSRHTVL